ncbi:MAG: hypothetical protein Q8Q91_00300, partial [Candidatus Daviesbacteria bacterium]|nr:hypothetical protein [Candidatus Daviesbacteria bacterium]
MKIILFDIDDTLLVCPYGANKKGSEVMFKRVFDMDANEEMINTKGKTDKQIISEVIRKVKGYPDEKEIEIPQVAFQEWATAIGELLKINQSLVLPGIWELLDSLQKNENVLLALLTGNSP